MMKQDFQDLITSYRHLNMKLITPNLSEQS